MSRGQWRMRAFRVTQVQLERVEQRLLAETQESGPRGRTASGGPQVVQSPP